MLSDFLLNLSVYEKNMREDFIDVRPYESENCLNSDDELSETYIFLDNLLLKISD